MRSLSGFFATLLILAAGMASGWAALDPAAVRGPSVELLVYEHRDCVYCQLFRRDVLPRYQQALAAGNDSRGLRRRVDTLPTVVLMLGGREIDRIVGYWGPDNFFKLLAHLRARAE